MILTKIKNKIYYENIEGYKNLQEEILIQLNNEQTNKTIIFIPGDIHLKKEEMDVDSSNNNHL
jgi:hypothetical protein